MAGISNPAYMRLCEEMGVGYAITELMSSEAIIRGNQKTFDMLNGIADLKIPVAVQLFGSNPTNMARAAKIITDRYENVFIDINMGCPVPKVALHSHAGSSLMKDPERVREIVKAVVGTVGVPVTVKMRSGWDKNNINAVEIAKICEEEGAKAICVHGRTRSQGYAGRADWTIIKAVKDSVAIPVIGNGDVVDGASAKKMFDETGVDAVMVGRACLGNPWIFKEISAYLERGEVLSKPSPQEKIDMCLKHMEYLSHNKPEKLVCLEMRNHIAWYLKGLKNANEIKNKVYLTSNINDIIFILNDYKKSLEE